MTEIYLLRHSEPNKNQLFSSNKSLQEKNENWKLTKKGKQIVKEKSKIDELKNFDIVYSSNYRRAILTAKYFTKNKIIIDKNFGERKFGINDWSELPENFEEKQFQNFDYKTEKGESLNEVIKRELLSLNKILEEHKNKKILIVGHSTAFASLLSTWCKVNYQGPYYFKNEIIFEGKWNYCETFKLIFNEKNKLIEIKNIK